MIIHYILYQTEKCITVFPVCTSDKFSLSDEICKILLTLTLILIIIIISVISTKQQKESVIYEIVIIMILF